MKNIERVHIVQKGNLYVCNKQELCQFQQSLSTNAQKGSLCFIADGD